MNLDDDFCINFHELLLAERPPKAERWEQFLNDIFPGEPGRKKIGRLQRFFGYCLLSDCRFQTFLLLVGAGGKGKSLVIRTLVDVLGIDRVCAVDPVAFEQRFLVGALEGKWLNISHEVAVGNGRSLPFFESALSGGLVSADTRGVGPCLFYPKAKHVFATIDPRCVELLTGRFRKKAMVIDFCDPVPWDPELISKLKEERAGIFSWMLDGLQILMASGSLYGDDEEG